MDTTSVFSAVKSKGRLRALPEDLEQILADRYYGLNDRSPEPASDLAKEYAPLSRTKSLSANGVRMIAQRVVKAREVNP